MILFYICIRGFGFYYGKRFVCVCGYIDSVIEGKVGINFVRIKGGCDVKMEWCYFL